jgi:hypothetical protein
MPSAKASQSLGVAEESLPDLKINSQNTSDEREPVEDYSIFYIPFSQFFKRLTSPGSGSRTEGLDVARKNISLKV